MVNGTHSGLCPATTKAHMCEMHVCLHAAQNAVAPGAPGARTGDVTMQHAHDAVRIAMVVDRAVVARRPDLQHEWDACASQVCHGEGTAVTSLHYISKYTRFWKLQRLLAARSLPSTRPLALRDARHHFAGGARAAHKVARKP